MTRAAERITTWELLIEDQLQTGSSEAWEVRCFQRLDSTMDAARDLAGRTKLRRGLVLAANQVCGRGRRGNTWLAAEQGFYATYLLHSEVDTARLVGYSLAAGLGVARYCATLGCVCKLKWPNDVLDQDGRKLCGILVEVQNCGERTFVLVGIGINLAGAPLGNQSTCLAEMCARRPPPYEVAAKLAPILHSDFERFESEGFAAFRPAWLASAYCLGELCTLEEGQALRRGRFTGVGENGELELLCDGEKIPFSTGQLRFL